MAGTEKAMFLDKILSEIDRISKDIAMLEESTRPEGALDMDEISRMDAIVTKNVNNAALLASKNRLNKLKYALKRSTEPEFGHCMDCGEKIPVARLLAMPETALCIGCAQ